MKRKTGSRPKCGGTVRSAKKRAATPPLSGRRVRTGSLRIAAVAASATAALTTAADAFSAGGLPAVAPRHTTPACGSAVGFVRTVLLSSEATRRDAVSGEWRGMYRTRAARTDLRSSTTAAESSAADHCSPPSGTRADPTAAKAAGGGGDDNEAAAMIEELRRQAKELDVLLALSETPPRGFDPFRVAEGGGKILPATVVAPTSKDRNDSSSVATAAAIAWGVGEEERRPSSGISEVWFARMLVIVAAALYGTNFSVVKVLDETMPVGISTTLRFLLAAAAGLPWLLASSSVVAGSEGEAEIVSAQWELSRKRASGLMGWWDRAQSSAASAAAIAGFEVGMWNSIGYIAQAIGLETTEAGKSAFICSLAVVIVPILDFLAGKKFLPRELVGAAMAVAGVGLLEFGGGEGLHSLSSGDVASLIQPLAFGMGFWRMEDVMHRHPGEATRATAAQMLAVFLASAAFCLLGPGGQPSHPPTDQIVAWLTDPMIFGSLLWTGIVTTALTVYMETLALKTLSAAETTMIFSTEPLWGAAFAGLVLGERFGVEAGMGAALILSGIAFSNVGLDWLKGKGENQNDRESAADSAASKKFTDSPMSENLPSGKKVL